MRRAITSLNRVRGEDGVTLVELLVTAAIMSIVSTAVIAMAMRVVGTSATIVDRRDVLGDGRVALDRMTKQIRQAESVDTTFSCGGAAATSQLKILTYIDGTAKTVVWKVFGTAQPYVLKESADGGTSYQTVASSLRTLPGQTGKTKPFKCTQHAGLTDQVTINLSLGWPSTDVLLTSDVYLRNAT